jgi:hypothetical protein
MTAKTIEEAIMLAHENKPAFKVAQETGFIPIGQTNRATVECRPPAEVEQVSDLPARLFLGALDHGSFSKRATGWSVRYVDADPQTFVEIDFDTGNKHPLVVRHVWRGIEGVVTHTKGSWQEATRYGGLFSGKWHRHINTQMCSRYNLRVFEEPKTPPFQFAHSYPEGFYFTLLCPVPTHRLIDLVKLLDILDADYDVAGRVLMYVVKTPSRIEYVRDRCFDIPKDPVEVATYSRQRTGLPCRGLPYWDDSGISILHVNRWVYLAHIVFPLRDLERVLAHGRAQGFLSANVGDQHLSEYPYGVEWAWHLLPGNPITQTWRIRVYDNMPSRQVFYYDLLPGQYKNMIKAVSRVNRKTALAVAAFAQVQAASEKAIQFPTRMGDVEIIESDLQH